MGSGVEKRRRERKREMGEELSSCAPAWRRRGWEGSEAETAAGWAGPSTLSLEGVVPLLSRAAIARLSPRRDGRYAVCPSGSPSVHQPHHHCTVAVRVKSERPADRAASASPSSRRRCRASAVPIQSLACRCPSLLPPPLGRRCTVESLPSPRRLRPAGDNRVSRA